VNLIAELLGHSTNSITLERYGKQLRPKFLYDEVVSKLKFDILI